MKLVFVGGVLDHITLPLCLEFERLLGLDFTYVATKPYSESRKDLGAGFLNDKYAFVKKWYEDNVGAENLICNADVVIYGSAPEKTIKERLKNDKLTFRFTERLYKEPFNIRNLLHRLCGVFLHHAKYPRKNTYILCAGAYAAYDFNRFGLYKDHLFKWGYFTQVTDKSVNELFNQKSKNAVPEIIWTARFVDVKHPEIVVKLAQKLLEKNEDFHITMIGGGKLFNDIRKQVVDNALEDYIALTGTLSPDETRKRMEKSNISIFTSDRREGWGAVVNEAMGCACACVSSVAAGSAPFLIEDGVNGLLFNIEDDSLLYKILALLHNPNAVKKMGEIAYNDIHKYWNAKNGAECFVRLSESILIDNIKPEIKGPCSIARVLKDGWYNGKNKYYCSGI